MIFTILWIAWIAALFIVEGLALHHDMPGATLSEHVQRWWRVDTHIGRTVFLIVWLLFAVWFPLHIVWHWPI